MRWEDELRALARGREDEFESRLSQTVVEHPGKLLRQLRSYLAELTDRARLKKTYDDVLRLKTLEGGIQELVCEEVEFRSESRLSFSIQMKPEQGGWSVKRFKFDLHLVGRSINMIRIHLNQDSGHDPLSVPRCHFHVGDSKAHIPFPIMNPRLMLHLLCEGIEPDLGR